MHGGVTPLASVMARPECPATTVKSLPTLAALCTCACTCRHLRSKKAGGRHLTKLVAIDVHEIERRPCNSKLWRKFLEVFCGHISFVACKCTALGFCLVGLG